MADLKFTTTLQKYLKNEVCNGSKYCGHFLGKYVYLFMEPINRLLVFKSNLAQFICEKSISNKYSTVKIVGNENHILILDTEGKLENYFATLQRDNFRSSGNNSTLKSELVFKNVLAITEYKDLFACVRIDEKKKQFIVFGVETLPNYEDYTFSDLNASESRDYYLKAVKKPFNSMGLVISDKVSGKTYLCLDNGQTSAICFSRIPLISVISIESEDSLLLCFKNGKLILHFFSEVCPDKVLFLNSTLVCIEKCFCNDRCLLWSDGVILHHSEISFCKGSLNLRNFKIENNIMGITSFMKIEEHIIASSINNTLYEICSDVRSRKEIFQPPGNVLSQIYDESLKIHQFLKEFESAVEYVKCKEMMENYQMHVNLKCEGDDLIIKNSSQMTIKKESWTIELRRMSEEEVQVKMVKLETDFMIGTVIKIKNPFDRTENLKVYFVGKYEMQILNLLIGVVWKEDNLERKSLKEMISKDFIVQKQIKKY